jgi:hypothetical protein
MPRHPGIDDEVLRRAVELSDLLVHRKIDLGVVLGREIRPQRIHVGDHADLAKEPAGADERNSKLGRQAPADRRLSRPEIPVQRNSHFNLDGDAPKRNFFSGGFSSVQIANDLLIPKKLKPATLLVLRIPSTIGPRRDAAEDRMRSGGARSPGIPGVGERHEPLHRHLLGALRRVEARRGDKCDGTGGELFEALAQHLAPLPEGRLRHGL